jgi:hypothetical protein
MRRVRTALVGILACAFSAAARPANATAILSIEPSIDVVQVGDTFTLNVDIASISDLYGYQFDIVYDPTILAADAVTAGSFFDPTMSIFFPGTIDNTLGTISFVYNSLIGDTSMSGDGTLAMLTFTAIGLTTTDPTLITIANVMLSPFTLDPNAFPEPITDFTVASGSVSTVPEPSSLALVGLGVATVYGRWRCGHRDKRRKIRSTV